MDDVCAGSLQRRDALWGRLEEVAFFSPRFGVSVMVNCRAEFGRAACGEYWRICRRALEGEFDGLAGTKPGRGVRATMTFADLWSRKDAEKNVEGFLLGWRGSFRIAGVVSTARVRRKQFAGYFFDASELASVWTTGTT